MGSSYWNDDFYRDREAVRKAENKPVFAYDADVKAGKVAKKVHAQMDPKGVKIRESRDSKEHPDSLAIGVVFDITGSMGSVPGVLQAQLPKLMNLLLSKNYVKDPQILIGAVGDTTCDPGSLQVGQFESGIEIDEDLKKLWVVGGGGGQTTESYQNAMYFFARHTATDCFEKRGKKGYLFLIGDELPYQRVSKAEIKALCGEDLEADIMLADIVKEVQERYHVFYLIPQHTSHGRDPRIQETWRKLLGAENVLLLEDEQAVCEMIGLTIGLCEGTASLDTARKDLQTAGASPTVVNSVAASLGTLARTKGRAGAEPKTARL